MQRLVYYFLSPDGEPTASGGNMGCHQGDGIDQITYLLAVWGWACTVVCYVSAA